VYNKAVCNNDNKILLYHNPAATSHQSATIMCHEGLGSSRHHKAEILTDAIKIDTFVKEKNIDHIDLLYADVEGAQKELLLGAQSSLEKTDYLFLETQELWGGPTKTQLTKMLADRFVIEIKLGPDTVFKNINSKEDK
jgi:FkbM family methyltransferase